MILLKPHVRELGGFSVRRLLPALAARTIGPFIFFDHMGPARFAPGTGIDVRPHPHIGLATVTYLFEGTIMHRDSLGSVQKIVPGDVNWMTAGRGIVHSERTPPAERAAGSVAHGIQTWVALPAAQEDLAPEFHHYPSASLPQIEQDGVTLRVIAGTAFGRQAPVKVFSPTLYVAAHLRAGAALRLEPEHEQRGVYLVEGDLRLDGEPVPQHHLAVLPPGAAIALRSENGARAMLVGGAKLDGERFIEWNFVSSQRAKIERAKASWQAQQLGSVPGETEWIALPEPAAPSPAAHAPPPRRS